MIAKPEFAEEAFSKEAWEAVADELLLAASRLAPDIDAWWRAIDQRFTDPSVAVPQNSCLRVYLMLVGFALENLVKGELVRGLSETERQEVRDTGKLPARIASHRLADLLNRIGLDPDWLDEMTLSYMEAHAVWLGRYPVPLHADRYYMQPLRSGERVGTSLRGNSDHNYAYELVERVRAHIAARQVPSAPGA